MVRRMRLVALMAMMLLGLVATAAGPVAASTVYVDTNGQFAVGIADGWAKQPADTKGVLALWTIDGGAAIFNIVRDDVPAGTSSVDYAQASVDTVSGYNGYTELRRVFITCADQQCPLLDYTVIDNNGETQRIQQTFVTKGSDGWVLTFRTRASDAATYKSDVEIMLYSFTFA